MTDKNEMVNVLDELTVKLGIMADQTGKVQPFRCGKRQLELAKLAARHVGQAVMLVNEIVTANTGGPKP